MDDEAKTFNLHLNKISESTGAYFLLTGPDAALSLFQRDVYSIYTPVLEDLSISSHF